MLVHFKAEMWRKNISQAQICREVGISEKSMVSNRYEISVCKRQRKARVNATHSR